MRGERWIVLFLLLAASGLAWRDLHRPAIWFDEGWSGWVARMSLEEGLRKAAQDRHPPLRPLLDHMWIRIAGETEFALRWPSSAFALLALALAWRAYYRLRFEPPGGCIGMGAILLSSLWLEQTRQARMYTQAAFLALLSWWTMEDWLRRPGSWHRWGLWLLSSFTFLMTHYYTVFFLAVEMGLLLRYTRGWMRAKTLLVLGLGGLGIGAWMAFGGISTGLFTPQSRDLADHPLQGIQTMGLALRSLVEAHAPGSSPPEVALMLSLWLIGMRPTGHAVASRWRWLTVGSLTIALIVMAGIRSNLLNFAPRHVLYVLPFMGIGVGRGIALLWRWSARVRLAGARKALAYLGLLLPIALSVNRLQAALSQWDAAVKGVHPERDLVALIKKQAQEGDLLFTLRGHYGIRYYWAQSSLALPLIDGPQTMVTSDEIVSGWLSPPLSACTGERRLWLIAWQDDIVDPLALFPRWLLWNGFEEKRDAVGGLRLYRYRISCPPQSPPAPALERPVDFAPGIRLRGVQIWPPRSQDRILRITTVWERTGPIREPVKIFHHMYDRFGRLIAQEDVPLARGLYPIADWPTGVPIMLFAGIRLPSEMPPGLQQVAIGLYHPMTMARYPVRSPASGEDTIRVATVDLPSLLGRWQSLPIRGPLVWDDGIALTGVWLDPGPQVHPGETLRVLTSWVRMRADARESSEPVVTFIHLWGEDEHLIALDDHPLLEERHPPSQWEPWESVWDRFDLRIPEDLPAGAYRLMIGRYEWPALERIHVHGQDHYPLTTVGVLP
jgi:hypothetical protein